MTKQYIYRYFVAGREGTYEYLTKEGAQETVKRINKASPYRALLITKKIEVKPVLAPVLNRVRDF